MKRSKLIKELAQKLSFQRCNYPAQPLRVAIDGIDAAGKTTLADELEEVLRNQGYPIIRASIDHFHNPRAIRYAFGADSPNGYFENSFNTQKVIDLLLRPLGPNGSGAYQTGIFDYQSNEETNQQTMIAPKHAILLFDGIFLMKPELLPYWDFKIFLEIEFETCLKRVETRDQHLFGHAAEVRERYETRYIPGQKIYFETCSPKKMADMIIRNDDPENPIILT
jgi:uridine kinase